MRTAFLSRRSLTDSILSSVSASGYCIHSRRLIIHKESCRLCITAIAFLFASWPIVGQEMPAAQGGSAFCADLKPGVAVEAVGKNSEAEKAGLTEGDTILFWSQGDRHGGIASPFDLAAIEVEFAPRGDIALDGTRGAATQRWVLKSDKWGVKVRPNGFPPGVDHEKTLEQIGHALHRCGDIARDAGVEICRFQGSV